MAWTRGEAWRHDTDTGAGGARSAVVDLSVGLLRALYKCIRIGLQALALYIVE